MADRPVPLRNALVDMPHAFAAGSVPGQVTLAALPVTGQLGLRGDPADRAFLHGAAAALGVSLPLEANRMAGAGDVAVLWLGPGEWLVTAPLARIEVLQASLATSLCGQHVAIVDVSANRAILALAGPKAPEVLMKGCGLDLDADRFKPGDCAQTNLARVQVILARPKGEPRYHLFVRPSFAAYLAAWLLDAMTEYHGVSAGG